jgi:hypothetical protein
MMALSAEDFADLRRWAICGAIIVLAHGAIASKPVDEPPPETKPAPNPDVALEPPHQKVTSPQRQEQRTPAPTTSAPQALPEQTAALPAAPTQGWLTPNRSNAVPTWKTQIVALLGAIRKALNLTISKGSPRSSSASTARGE